MYWQNDYSEQTWRNDADARERSEARREAIAMSDWQNDFRPQLCDGGGILEEHYTDVDQTTATKCPGCPACETESEIDRATRRAPITTPRFREVA